MRTRIPKPALALLIALLAVGNAFLFAFILWPQERALTVAFLDVGQGDAIYIESPTGVDLLIDGGKDRSAVRELPKIMGPLDRKIDIVLATHPDADHIGGLPEVLSRYRAGTILESGKAGDSSQADRLTASIRREAGAVYGIAKQGMRIHLGDGAYADVLFPEGNASQLRETNDASVVLRLVYGDSEFMLTGDAPSWVEGRLAQKYGTGLRSDVLKAGHHGSRTSSSDAFLAAVMPQTVVVSAGKDNPYGHPHPEVLESVREIGASVVSTAESGTIVFRSDGKSVMRVR
ncbi:MAG TPA: ComEC/Rec2 family competence protein [Candidatus Paceibacterota bacterium]